jgi:hypothetical protein
MVRLAVLATVAGLAVAIAAGLPDIKRYLKMRAM